MAANPPRPFGSLGRVDRAGHTLRAALTGEDPRPSLDDIREARAVVDTFRSAHEAPLNAARMGLQSFITTLKLEFDISRRLKRMPTIEDKLRREPGMKLSRMQDIGGCRAVLPTQGDVNRVLARFTGHSLRRNQQPDTVRNYSISPQDSGYRAVHIHTRYQGRRIEVQLRTPPQDRWAKAVEDLTSRSGIDYKSGDGADEVHRMLRRLSEILRLQEVGQALEADLIQKLTRLAMPAAPYPENLPTTSLED